MIPTPIETVRQFIAETVRPSVATRPDRAYFDLKSQIEWRDREHLREHRSMVSYLTGDLERRRATPPIYGNAELEERLAWHRGKVAQWEEAIAILTAELERITPLAEPVIRERSARLRGVA